MPTRLHLASALLALLAACGRPHRLDKFLLPEQFAIASAPRGELATVMVATGWEYEPPAEYQPEPFEQDGVNFERTVAITEDGWIELIPHVEGLTVELSTRHGDAEFRPVQVLTGGIVGRLPNEIRPVPERVPIGAHWHLTMKDLVNVYSPTQLKDGDLLLLTLREPGGRIENYLLREQDFGFRTRAGAGLLLRAPLPFTEDTELSPALAATLAIGYRPRSQRPGIDWVGDQVALVVSAGVGSSTIDIAGPNLDELRGVVNAGLIGGGVELFAIASGQILVNVSAFTRDGEDAPLSLAVGLDAVQAARFTRNAAIRLFRANELKSPRMNAPIDETPSTTQPDAP